LLPACTISGLTGGHGTSLDGSTGHDASRVSRDGGSAVDGSATGPVTIVLSHLPPSQTTRTGASITSVLVPVRAGYSIWCRLDAYTPITCPEPFILGATAASALSLGPHSVDFWAREGMTVLDLSQPTKSYSWTIVSADAAAPFDASGTRDASAGGATLPSAFHAENGTAYGHRAPTSWKPRMTPRVRIMRRTNTATR
jgi:hypothetical protein